MRGVRWRLIVEEGYRPDDNAGGMIHRRFGESRRRQSVVVDVSSKSQNLRVNNAMVFHRSRCDIDNEAMLGN